MTWVDPVCGMVVRGPNAPRTVFNGVEYRFCMQMCRDAFTERPGRYLKLGEREDRVKKIPSTKTDVSHDESACCSPAEDIC